MNKATPEAERFPSLARALREQTAGVHRDTENAPLMRAVLKGEIDRAAYAGLLAALLPVYRALEESLDALRDDTRFAFVPLPALARTPSLEADLAHLGEPLGDRLAAESERSDYVARIHDVAAGDPLLLLAHAYTRYMGDLSGGQILGRVVAKNLGVSATAGASFFDFPAIEDVERAKDEFRMGLDGLRLDSHATQSLVLEAKLSFRLNRLLAQRVWEAVVAGAWASAAAPA